jgi:S1-C subfamily serine protease
VRTLELSQKTGVIILEVAPSSPAHRAKLLTRDIIVRIADIPVTNPDDLHRFLDDHALGKQYEIVLLRGAHLRTLTITPEEMVSPA